MKFVLFIFVSLLTALVHGCKPGERRIVVSANLQDPCVQDSQCFDNMTQVVSELFKTNQVRALASTQEEDNERNLRGSRELCKNVACVKTHGLYICIMWGWCGRRRTLGLDLFEPTNLLRELDDPNWKEIGITNEAALTANVKEMMGDYDCKGLSFRIQVCVG